MCKPQLHYHAAVSTTDPAPATALASENGGQSARPSRQSAAAARRREREQQILDATRRLFDETGVRDAQIEDIARAVGINRAIIYRHFSGKEELFALTVERYLGDLRVQMETAAAGADPAPAAQLTAMVESFIDFGLEFPAFVDCAQTLMRTRGPDLLEQISEGALFRLGRAITACLRPVRDILDAGTESGDFQVTDSTLLANYMYATGLGGLQLARIGMLVSETAPGIPTISRVSADQVRHFLVTTALALARQG